MKPLRLTHCCVAALALALGAGQVQAKIEHDKDSFELFLVVMDQTTAQMSYVLDLGINAMDFSTQGQQDNGASLFRTLDPAADHAFQTFMAAADLSKTRWMVLGFNDNTANPAAGIAFTTLTNNHDVATQTRNFDRMFDTVTDPVLTGIGTYSNYLNFLNAASAPLSIKETTHNSTTIANGSSLASKLEGNTGSYLGKATGFSDATFASDGDCIFGGNVCSGNPLGISSWFYRLTPALIEGEPDPAERLNHDEFDNLAGDGFWGFVKDPSSSKYILSYTLAGANPAALTSTVLGRSRLASIDYSAQSGPARLIGIGIGAGDVAFAVTAVPEPESWALMMTGIAAFAGIRRLRRSKQA